VSQCLALELGLYIVEDTCKFIGECVYEIGNSSNSNYN
jgi:hypothetical protein